MITYKKALEILKKGKIKLKNEKILSKNTTLRISAENIYSPENYPSSDNTAFDGFAINSKDTNQIKNNNPIKFRILKTLAAGDDPSIKNIQKFSTIEVMTGAIIKKPFDTVIPIEQIEYFPNKDKAKYIFIRNKVNKHNYLRFGGSDYKKEQKIIGIGEIIRSSHILAFKTLGIDKVLVKKKPVLAFYPTGKEISNLKKIPIWKVRNSNGHYLSSLINNLPITFKTQKILRDNDQIIFKKEIKKHLKSNTNIIITSGAVSAGKFDFVPGIIRNFKLANSFKGVAIRPGKPILFSKFKNKNIAFFGLPGNPISSAACFRFFIFPFLSTCLNIKKEKPFKAKLKNVFIKKKNFTRFIKGKISFSSKGLIEFEVLKGQESFRINSFTKANSWGFFPSGKSKFKKGQFIDCFTVLPKKEILINWLKIVEKKKFSINNL